MRIALVSLHTSPLARPGTGDAGGMNVVLVGLADALTAAGHDVELITRAEAPDAAAGSARTLGGTPVRSLVAGPAAPLPKSQLIEHVGEFGEALAALPPFDVVHANYWLSGLASLPAAEAWGVPHVLSLHTVAAMKNDRLAAADRPESAERLAGERMLVHASDLILAHTAAERSALLEHYAADPRTTVVVPPGADTSLFHPVPAADPAMELELDGVDGGRSGRMELQNVSAPELHPVARAMEPFVLVLARIQPLKGVDLAIRAIAAVPEPLRPRLVVAGGVSPGHEEYAAHLAGLAAELGVADRVEFRDAVGRAEAAVLLRGASLLLVPSHSETFGLVALEAAASGTPVVASRSTGLLDSVSDGVSGVLLDSREPGEWGRVIAGLLDDPPRLESLSRSAVAFGARRSWAAVADDITAHYDAAIARRTRDAAVAAFGLRPVFVHAHPDDESISTGGTIAALVAAGADVALITGTRGERGEVVPGPLHGLEGTDALAPHRERELITALGELAPTEAPGTLAHAFLGSPPARRGGTPRLYADSGMRWGDDGLATAASDAPADALSLAPLDEVVEDLLAGVSSLAPRPTAIVSYDAIGGYGHPDHVRMHDAAIAAAAALRVPSFAIVEPRIEPGPEPRIEPDTDASSPVELTIRLGPFARQKARAMAAHATQLTVAADDGSDGAGTPREFTLSGGQRHPIGVVERFRPFSAG
jgi:glycosyltransferase involved in cell wall biosynthesis/LmbE family N-acetylglucosaminyl deacetylase